MRTPKIFYSVQGDLYLAPYKDHESKLDSILIILASQRFGYGTPKARFLQFSEAVRVTDFAKSIYITCGSIH